MTKRRHERTEFQTEAIIRHNGLSIQGEVENLSLKGLFVKTDQQIPVDEPVEIEIYFHGLSGELSFTLQATVVRITENGIGFNFQKIDIDSVNLMRKPAQEQAS